jgi:hypothetical protein
MPYPKKQMPLLWRVQDLLTPSDKYPSGLEWYVDKACNKAGTQAGRYNKRLGFYKVCIDAEVYLAHRVVIYLKTGEDPGQYPVKHTAANIEKDNRQRYWFSTEEKCWMIGESQGSLILL